MKSKQTFWFLTAFLLVLGLTVVMRSAFGYTKTFDAAWHAVPGEDDTLSYTIEECHRTPTETTWANCTTIPNLDNPDAATGNHMHSWTRSVNEGDEGRFRIRTDSSDATVDSSAWSAAVRLVMPADGIRGDPQYIAVNDTACTLSGTMTEAGGGISATDATGIATCPATINLTSNYYLWVMVKTVGGGGNSFHLTVGPHAECELHLEAPRTSWAWELADCSVNGDPSDPFYSFHLAGSFIHDVTFRHRETGSELSRLMLTNSASWTPSISNTVTVDAIPLTTANSTVTVSGSVTPGTYRVGVGAPGAPPALVTEIPVQTGDTFSTVVPLMIGNNAIDVSALTMKGNGTLAAQDTQTFLVERSAVAPPVPTGLSIGPGGP